jgi:hypothetical protein
MIGIWCVVGGTGAGVGPPLRAARPGCRGAHGAEPERGDQGRRGGGGNGGRADSIDDLDRLRHGGMGRLFTGIRAPSALGICLRSFTFGNVRQLDKVATQLLVNLAQHTPLMSDADRLLFGRCR